MAFDSAFVERLPPAWRARFEGNLGFDTALTMVQAQLNNWAKGSLFDRLIRDNGLGEPGNTSTNVIAHAMFSAWASKHYGVEIAEVVGVYKEYTEAQARIANGQNPLGVDTFKDYWNNGIGLQIGRYAAENNLSDQEMTRLVMDAYVSGQFIRYMEPGTRPVGDPGPQNPDVWATTNVPVTGWDNFDLASPPIWINAVTPRLFQYLGTLPFPMLARCFSSDVKVHLADGGWRSIAEVFIGDSILAFQSAKGNDLQSAVVTRILQVPRQSEWVVGCG
jgi:hypothetical protein